jgi:hypothetical protein
MLISCVSIDAGQWADTYGYDADHLIRFRVGKGGMPLIPAIVAGRQTEFAFDTGNLVGPKISAGLARDLGLPVIGTWRSLDSSGEYRATYSMFGAESLLVLGSSMTDVSLAEMGDEDYKGSIGTVPLFDRRFTLSFRGNLLGIGDSPLPQTLGGARLPLIWNDRQAGMIVVRGSVGGIETMIQIDSGKSRTTIDRRLVDMLHLVRSDTLFLQGYRVEGIRIGDTGFDVPCAKVADFRGISQGYPLPILVGLGYDFLSNVTLTVDYRTRVVVVE